MAQKTKEKSKEVKEVKQVLKRNRCPECTSTQTLFRIKTNEFVCRSCGHIWPKELK